LHNFGAIFLGALSIFCQSDSRFNERISILWSIGYFAVDIVDCSLRGDGIYLLHGVFCLMLGVANYTTPLCRQLRVNSKASFLELSNPIMHLAKKTRKPLHFALFAIVYTLCRIIWIPILIRQLVSAGMSWRDPRLVGLLAFYGLNLFWYYKILRIMFGKREDNKKQA
jgi:hypothetical protein